MGIIISIINKKVDKYKIKNNSNLMSHWFFKYVIISILLFGFFYGSFALASSHSFLDQAKNQTNKFTLQFFKIYSFQSQFLEDSISGLYYQSGQSSSKIISAIFLASDYFSSNFFVQTSDDFIPVLKNSILDLTSDFIGGSDILANIFKTGILNFASGIKNTASNIFFDFKIFFVFEKNQSSFSPTPSFVNNDFLVEEKNKLNNFIDEVGIEEIEQKNDILENQQLISGLIEQRVIELERQIIELKKKGLLVREVQKIVQPVEEITKKIIISQVPFEGGKINGDAEFLGTLTANNLAVKNLILSSLTAENITILGDLSVSGKFEAPKFIPTLAINQSAPSTVVIQQAAPIYSIGNAISLETIGVSKDLNVVGNINQSNGSVNLTSATISSLTVSGDTTISGNFTVSGAQTFSGAQTITANSIATIFTVNQTGAGAIFDLQKSGLSKVFVDNNGNVGIGTTTPAALLHVNSTANPGIQIGNGVTGYLKVGDSVLSKTSGSNWIISSGGFQPDSDNNMVMGASGARYNKIWTTNIDSGASNFTLKTNSTDRMTINTNGNIGINSSTNLSELTVTAPADVTNIGGTTTVNNSTTVTGVGTTFTTSLGVGDRISVSSVASTYSTVTNIASDTSLTVFTAIGNGTSQTINKKTSLFRIDNASNVQKFLVNDLGNVIIGNVTATAPQTETATLNVIGATSSDTLVRLMSNSQEFDTRLFLGENINVGMTFEYDGLANIAGIRVGGTNLETNSRRIEFPRDTTFANFMAGNVGVGTTTPSSKLDITTTVLGTTQTTSSGLALVNTTAAAAGLQQISPAIRWSGFGWKTDATAASQAVDFRSYVVPVQGTANPTGYLSFGSSVNGAAYNEGQMVITSAGNVGIGTTGPSYSLDVNGNIHTNNNFIVDIGKGISGAGDDIIFTDSSGTTKIMRMLNFQNSWVDNTLSSFFQMGQASAIFSGASGAILNRLGISATGTLLSDIIYSSLPAPLGILDVWSTTPGHILVVRNTGNVGVGESNPTTGKLVINQTDAANLEGLYINSEESTATQSVFSIETDTSGGSGVDTLKFKITADGSVYSDANIYSTPADIAEMYYVEGDAESGDIVEIIDFGQKDNSIHVSKSSSKENNRLIGVISTNPGPVIGYDWKNPEKLLNQRPVALAGRVPVKVSLENGPIQIGDRLTSSSAPGVAMKAIQSGQTIGIALENFDGQNAFANGFTVSQIGKIMVFVNLGYHKLDEQLIDNNSTNSGWIVEQSTGRIKTSLLGDFDFENRVLNNVRAILSSGGNWSLDENGKLIVKEIETDKLTVGKSNKPSGVTLYDKITGAPYCLSIASGIAVTESGICDIQNQLVPEIQTETLNLNSETIMPDVSPLPSFLPENYESSIDSISSDESFVNTQ